MAYYNEKIKELRRLNGYTLKDVAKKLGVTEATAQRYESAKGIKDIPYKKLLLYAELFATSPAEIMGWDAEQSNEVMQETDNTANELMKQIRAKAENMNAEQLEQLLKYAKFIEQEGE